jgi:hypothetical protein
MKQVIQDFKSGRLYVDEVPAPVAGQGNVLVCSQYSLISAGTERSTVTTAQASLLGKARSRPDLVKQVIETYHKAGFAETFDLAVEEVPGTTRILDALVESEWGDDFVIAPPGHELTLADFRPELFGDGAGAAEPSDPHAPPAG